MSTVDVTCSNCGELVTVPLLDSFSVDVSKGNPQVITVSHGDEVLHVCIRQVTEAER